MDKLQKALLSTVRGQAEEAGKPKRVTKHPTMIYSGHLG
jgi:hypothetical protein